MRNGVGIGDLLCIFDDEFLRSLELGRGFVHVEEFSQVLPHFRSGYSFDRRREMDGWAGRAGLGLVRPCPTKSLVVEDDRVEGEDDKDQKG